MPCTNNVKLSARLKWHEFAGGTGVPEYWRGYPIRSYVASIGTDLRITGEYHVCPIWRFVRIVYSATFANMGAAPSTGGLWSAVERSGQLRSMTGPELYYRKRDALKACQIHRESLNQ